MLAGLLLVGGIFGFIRFRIARAEHRQRVLQQRVDEAVAQVKTLRGMLPICARCKKIRDDSGYWQQVEEYVHSRSEAEFSHGICPECMKELYPDFKESE